ncbi:hypothetical protein QBC46DRAFT_384654 [Diplogelasinospora grovesii]|uniref:Casein kinase substrate phosphoprotein PP28 domain-containing protein n=1 Tax=Diplogelasinospora grovesii TaxID=303347 RepID=A0AAN6N891_9PEZI|nr:hypothetical protein QBC46DRAFT_384654 [Diplogelasinospora grovesii]
MAPSDITSGVSRLSLKTKKKVEPVADSWEDEDVESESSETEAEPAAQQEPSQRNRNRNRDDEQEEDNYGDDEAEEDHRVWGGESKSTGRAGTTAPPPTPMSPSYNSRRPFSPITPGVPVPDSSGSEGGGPGQRNRPEKTDAVARRIIASALGIKVQRTKEQEAYDDAIKKREKERREKEKEIQRRKEEEAAKARQAVWED